MESNWGRVLYSNLLASIPCAFMMVSEYDVIKTASRDALLVVFGTVVIGATS